MDNTLAKNVPLGKGWHNTGTTVSSTDYDTSLEGYVWEGEDYSSLSTGGVKIATKRSNRKVVRILVRNTAAFNLLPKRLVSWASGTSRSKRVDGYVRLPPSGVALVGEVAGAVDEFWPAAGVPVGELFWLTVKGNALVKTGLAADATNVISIGDKLIACTGATSGATTAGRAGPAVAALDTAATGSTAAYIARYAFGTAQSAKTTGNTNADLLVEMDCTL